MIDSDKRFYCATPNQDCYDANAKGQLSGPRPDFLLKDECNLYCNSGRLFYYDNKGQCVDMAGDQATRASIDSQGYQIYGDLLACLNTNKNAKVDLPYYVCDPDTNKCTVMKDFSTTGSTSSDCQANCNTPVVDTTRYICDLKQGTCSPISPSDEGYDVNLPATLSDCESSCTAIPNKYVYDKDKNDCIKIWATDSRYTSAYDSLNKCKDDNLPVIYKCDTNTYTCMPYKWSDDGYDPNGQDISDCKANCVAPPPKRYSCNQDTWTCYEDPNGSYFKDDCATDCVPPPDRYFCNATTNDYCTKISYNDHRYSLAQYDDIDSCNANCSKPVIPPAPTGNYLCGSGDDCDPTNATIDDRPDMLPADICKIRCPTRGTVKYKYNSETDRCELINVLDDKDNTSLSLYDCLTKHKRSDGTYPMPDFPYYTCDPNTNQCVATTPNGNTWSECIASGCGYSPPPTPAPPPAPVPPPPPVPSGPSPSPTPFPPPPPTGGPPPHTSDFPNTLNGISDAIVIRNNDTIPIAVVFDKYKAPCLPISNIQNNIATCLPPDGTGKCSIPNLNTKAAHVRIKGNVEGKADTFKSCTWDNHDADINIVNINNQPVDEQYKLPSPEPHVFPLYPQQAVVLKYPNDGVNTYWCSDPSDNDLKTITANRQCAGGGGFFTPYDTSTGKYLKNSIGVNRFEFNINKLDPDTVITDKNIPLMKNTTSDGVRQHYMNIAKQGIFYNGSAVDGINSLFDMYYTQKSSIDADPTAIQCTDRLDPSDRQIAPCNISLSSCPLNNRALTTDGNNIWTCISPKNFDDPNFTTTYQPLDFNWTSDDKDNAAAASGDDTTKLKYHKWWDFNSFSQNPEATSYTDFLRGNIDKNNVCNGFDNSCQQYAWAYDEMICKDGDCCPNAIPPTNDSYMVNPFKPLREPAKGSGTNNVLGVTVKDILPFKSNNSTPWDT